MNVDEFNQLVAEFLPPEYKHYTRDEVLSRMELAYQAGRNCGMTGVLGKLAGDADSGVDIETGGG